MPDLAVNPGTAVVNMGITEGITESWFIPSFRFYEAQMSPTEDSQSILQREQRWKAVNDPETAAQDLEIIISQGCRGLVRRAAEHPRVSLELLITLSQHEDPEVRAAIVDNHQASSDLHWQLAKDECADVRYAVAESYLVDMAVLSSLLEDANPYISHRARATLQKRNVHLLVAADFPEGGAPADGSDRTTAL